MAKLKMSEGDLLRLCADMLNQLHIPYIRNGNFVGQITRPNGSKGFIRNSSYPGSPDLLIFREGGVTIHCELKSEIGKQSDDQREYQERIERLGHRYVLIRTPDEFVKLIR